MNMAAPLFTAGATYTAGGAGAGSGAMAALANPYTAALAAAAAAAAYSFSPSVRKTTNKFVKKGYEGITNPFQHFGDGSEKDTLMGRGLSQGRIGTGLMPKMGMLVGQDGFMQGSDGQLDTSPYDTPPINPSPIAQPTQPAPPEQKSNNKSQQKNNRQSPTENALNNLLAGIGGGIGSIPIAHLTPPDLYPFPTAPERNPVNPPRYNYFNPPNSDPRFNPGALGQIYLMGANR